MAPPKPRLHLSGEVAADELISADAFALLIGMVLDQQIPLERAFAAPAELARRLGGKIDPGSLAAMDPDELAEAFKRRPALHRFPGSMAGRVQELARIISRDYAGDAAMIWRTAKSGEELLGRVNGLPGFGAQKAKIFVALLGKQLGARPAGWREASDPFGEPGSRLSIADIDSAEALVVVREHKRQMKAAAKKKAGAAAT
ncbi:MAG: HhH-GPD-type base excision DNA repair protein [Acidimicrobiales bacterium]